MNYKGQGKDNKNIQSADKSGRNTDFVLDKLIFINVFEKDIRRIYIYRKSERLAKAIHLITPAFGAAPALRNRLDTITIGLIDAAILPPSSARDALSRELLALSSFLSVARTGGLISEMNADLIAREAQTLLQEIAGYQEPRLFLEEVPTLAEFAKQASRISDRSEARNPAPERPLPQRAVRSAASAEEILEGMFPYAHNKGHLSDKPQQSGRQEAIIEVLRTKGPSYIKDISTVVRDVSEKTIQRELQSLVSGGQILRSGDRRWTRYFLPGQSAD